LRFFESAAGDRRLPSGANPHFNTMNTSDVAHPANVRQGDVLRRRKTGGLFLRRKI